MLLQLPLQLAVPGVVTAAAAAARVFLVHPAVASTSVKAAELLKFVP